jgi:pectate lyase-like protein
MANTLPNVGDLGWGPTLNNYITNVVLSAATNALADVLGHEVASDPHADRAYSNALISAINSAANLPGGFVRLNSFGLIPTNLVVAGGVTNIYDVVANFGATGNGVTDDSAAINLALAACAANGGGEVWIPNGTYAIGHSLVIGSNTWLNLSPGATIKRIANPGVPLYMLVNFTSLGVSGTGNIRVTGGAWTVGATTQSCVMMAFINASFVNIQYTQMTNSPGTQSCAVLFAGCNTCSVDTVLHYGAAPTTSRSSFTTAAIRVECSSANVIAGLIAGTYTGAGCQAITCTNHTVACSTLTDGSGPYCLYSYLIATLLNVGTGHSNILIQGCNCNGLANNPCFAFAPWTLASITGCQWTNCGSNIATTNISFFYGNATNNIQFDVNTWSINSLLNGWGGTLQYKRCDTNNIQVSCTGLTPGTKADGTIICTLPSGYRPASIQWGNCTTFNSSGTAYLPASFSCDTSGNVRCYGVGSNATAVHATCIFATDR